MRDETPPEWEAGDKTADRERDHDVSLLCDGRGRNTLYPWAAMAVFVAAPLSLVADLNAQTTREYTRESEMHTSSVWRNFPRWNAGLLVGYENNYSDAPVIYTIDRDGRREELLLAIADAYRISVRNVAMGADRRIAVVAGAYASDGRFATLLVQIPANRKDWTVTQTWPYCPMNVTIANDGAVWTIGWLKDEENTRVITRHVLRRYDANGILKGSQDVIARRGGPTINVSFFFSSLDRVGWLTTAGQYIEFALDGKEIGRYEGPPGSEDGDVSGAAISEDNNVLAGVFEKGMMEFAILSRQTGEWTAVSLPTKEAPSWARVLGFDNTTVVTATQNGKIVRFKPR